MFLLDTNVISELRKAGTDKINTSVEKWATTQLPSALYISAITILELEMGILQIERKDKKQGEILRTWLENRVLPSFTERILPIDTAIARKCANLHVPNPQSERDALIAATALTHGMIIITRNIVDFETTGAELINPWEIY